MRRDVLHVDMDAFFVSVERLCRPDLRDKPVVVGADNPFARGVVAAASYETRAFGVRSGMALSRAWKLCPEAVFVAPTPGAYGEASRAVRGLCEEVAPVVEMASVDEAYLDLTGMRRLYASVGEVADLLQRRIFCDLGLPVSFGWSENKLLSKVASGRSKPRGLLRVYPGGGRAFLAPLALRCLPGVGPRNAEVLGRYGLQRVGDLERLGERGLQEALGEPGRVLFHRARGEDASLVSPSRERKTMGREHTFELDVFDRPSLEASLSCLCEKLARDLYRGDVFAGRLALKLRYSDFKTLTRTTALPMPTRDDRVLYRTAWSLFELAWTRRVRVRLLGVTALDLCGGGWTLDLFEGNREERLARLAWAMERIRGRYGFGSILRGRSLLGKSR